jgi:hypothetical protein
MTARTEAKLNMYRATVQICDENASITSSNVAFTKKLNAIKANIAALLNTTQLESMAITGVSLDKTELKKTLCSTATGIAAIVFAFATDTGDNTLRESVRFAYSDLYRLKDDLLAPTALVIFDAANTNVAALADYGITAATLTSFASTIDAYSAAVPNPKTAISKKKTYTANISALTKAIDKQFKEGLDKLITTYKTTNPDFISNYTNARVIIDPKTTTKKIAPATAIPK